MQDPLHPVSHEAREKRVLQVLCREERSGLLDDKQRARERRPKRCRDSARCTGGQKISALVFRLVVKLFPQYLVFKIVHKRGGVVGNKGRNVNDRTLGTDAQARRATECRPFCILRRTIGAESSTYLFFSTNSTATE